jgi:hypothetical protein
MGLGIANSMGIAINKERVKRDELCKLTFTARHVLFSKQIYGSKSSWCPIANFKFTQKGGWTQL